MEKIPGVGGNAWGGMAARRIGGGDGLPPDRLFERSAAGLRPISSDDILTSRVQSSPDPPVVWSPPREEEPVSRPDGFDRSNRDTIRLPSNKRPLMVGEIKALMAVFGDQLEYEKVFIVMNSPYTIGMGEGYCRVVGNEIHIPSDAIPIDRLIHEAAHVWRFQKDWRGKGGYGYAFNAVAAHAASLAKNLWMTFRKVEGNQSDPYDFMHYVKSKRPWDEWNAEAQASFMEFAKQSPGGDKRAPEYWKEVAPMAISIVGNMGGI